MAHHSGDCSWLLGTQRFDHLEDVHGIFHLAVFHCIHEGTEYPRAAYSVTAKGEGLDHTGEGLDHTRAAEHMTIHHLTIGHLHCSASFQFAHYIIYLP